MESKILLVSQNLFNRYIPMKLCMYYYSTHFQPCERQSASSSRTLAWIGWDSLGIPSFRHSFVAVSTKARYCDSIAIQRDDSSGDSGWLLVADFCLNFSNRMRICFQFYFWDSSTEDFHSALVQKSMERLHASPSGQLTDSVRYVYQLNGSKRKVVEHG